jgi:predicted nicotinamide N-methyase
MSTPAWDDDDAPPLWSRPFDYGGLTVTVTEEWGGGIGGTVWEGGVLLSRFLASPAFVADARSTLGDAALTRRLTAIELGAGVSGLPAIVAAARGDVFRSVVASDIAECVPGLRSNMASNLPPGARLVEEEEGEGCQRAPPAPVNDWGLPASVVAAAADAAAGGRPPPPLPPPLDNASEPTDLTPSSHPVDVRVVELDWADAAPGRAAAAAALRCDALPFDVVLVADAVYVAAAMPALVGALRAVSGEGSFILLAYYLRSDAAHAAFWPRLRAAFDVHPIDATRFGCEAGCGEGTGLFRLARRGDAEWAAAEAARGAEEAAAAAKEEGAPPPPEA